MRLDNNDSLFCLKNCGNISYVLYNYTPINSNIQCNCKVSKNINARNEKNLSKIFEAMNTLECFQCHLSLHNNDIHYCKQCKHIYDYSCILENENTFAE